MWPAVRILYVIDSLVAGGAERSLAMMAGHLVRHGVEFHVAPLLNRIGVADELVAGGAIVHPALGAVRLRAVLPLRRLIHRVDPDLVHTTLFEADLAGRVAAGLARRPSVTSLVGGGFPVPPGAAVATRARFAAAQAADLVTARFAVRFHAVSASTAAAGRERLRLPAAKVDVIHRGRDLDALGRRTAPRRARVRADLGIDDATPVVLVVARHDPRKGLDVLVAAWPRITTAVPDAVLVVAGRDGPATGTIRRAIGQLPDPASVRLLGHRDDIGDLLAGADVLALCSLTEGLPGALLEALALEVPIVATDIEPVLEIVGHGGPARLVPPGEPRELAVAIVSTLANPPGPAALADGRDLVERSFTVAASAEAMVRFYERSLAGRRRAARRR